MSTQMFIVLLIGVMLLVYAGLAAVAYYRMRGKRVIVCPETQQPAAVTVDAGHAALSALRETPEIRLATCSRWPERQGCNQACAAQIAIAPEDTLAVTVLERWYAGKDCAICQRPIAPIHAGQPKPGLLNVAASTHETLRWEDITAEHLPAVLDSHLPVCASCHVADTFRRQFPDLVVDRGNPAESGRDIAIH
jgi:hypothetical protein